MKRTRMMWALCLVLLLGLLGACGQEEAMDGAAFPGQVQTVADVIAPEDLPAEPCAGYSAWDRAAQWTQLAQAGDGAATLYARRDDDASLYLLWNGYFYQMPWADERELELDMDLYLWDVDGDWMQELVAVSHARDSGGMGRDRLYLLEQGNGQLTQVTFPLEAFEAWLEQHCAAQGGQVTFFNLSTQAAEDGRLADNAALIRLTADGALAVYAQMSFQNGTPAAALTGGLSYRDGVFSVAGPWEIRSAADLEQESLVFVWTEGYLASPVGEERLFALTFYYREQTLPFALTDIVNATLDGVPGEAGMELTWEPAQIPEEEDYIACTIYCTYTPTKTGTFESEQVVFSLSDGTQVRCPFGHLSFDIGEADCGTVDTWESAAAFSSNAAFPYEFSPQGDALLTKIQYAPDAALEDENGLSNTGRISLTENYNAPVVLIMAKVWSRDGEALSLSYGKGCYCGAFSSSESILQRSLEHWAAG